MSRNAQSLSRLRAAFVVLFMFSPLAAAATTEAEAWAACEAFKSGSDSSAICWSRGTGAVWYGNPDTSYIHKSFPYDSECAPPNVKTEDENGQLVCGPPINNCSTDTIPGAGIMSSSGGGDINIGGGSGLYTVDGCAYSCGSNPAKWDGNHTYGQTLECKGLGVTPEEAEAGEAGPADLNCATDSSGKEICSDPDNPSCVTIDGISTCPSEGAICDELNGDLGCIDPAEEGCAYRNGKKECYDIFGQYIEHDSPDHPNNGGNMDGDTSNDMTDPRPEGEGGDPNNQPGDSTGEGGEATEGTAKESLEQQKIGNEKLDGIEESTGNIDEAIEAALDASRGDGTALKNGIDDAISNAGDSAVGDLDEHIDGIDSPAPMNEGDLGAIENNVTNLFAGSMQCRDLVFGTDEISYTITCNDMSMIRDMLGFLLYGFTVIRLFNVALRPAAKGTP